MGWQVFVFSIIAGEGKAWSCQFYLDIFFTLVERDYVELWEESVGRKPNRPRRGLFDTPYGMSKHYTFCDRLSCTVCNLFFYFFVEEMRDSVQIPTYPILSDLIYVLHEREKTMRWE